MPINFDRLPKESPNSLPAPGYYLAKVVKAEMKQPADTKKLPYLNLQLNLTAPDGTNAGTIFDIIAESDKPAIQYKLARFIIAANFGLTGDFELKDLTKIAVGRQFVTEVEHQPDNRDPDNRTKDQAKVRIFGTDIYWPKEMFAELTGSTISGSDDAEPFNAPDGNPAGQVTPGNY
jgi:hypothetical protein